MKNNIDIWLLNKEEILPLRSNWANILSVDEQQRANRFHFNEDSISFALYHACKRLILASYLNHSPKDIVFAQQEKGKPFLPSSIIKFNLSHTKNMAILAVAYNIEVGVDIEKNKPANNYLEIAKRFFHIEEYNYLKKIDNAQKQQFAFFEIWTAKEAILKATGQGIAAGMNNFCIQLDTTNQEALEHNYLSEISLLRLKTPEDYIGTLAAFSQSISVTYRAFLTTPYCDFVA